jgi:hypothetical protein
MYSDLARSIANRAKSARRIKNLPALRCGNHSAAPQVHVASRSLQRGKVPCLMQDNGFVDR